MADDTVLLFYDGHERRAEESALPRLRSDLRRHLRVYVNKLRGKQVMSGYYTWLHMLMEALDRDGRDVRLNDFKAARARPEQPIGLVGYRTIFPKVASLPNPRVIGPGMYPSPLDNPTLFDEARNKIYITTCDWHEDMFRPAYGERLRKWFGGFDVSRFEDSKDLPKKIDVMIYDKIYHDRERNYARTIGTFIPYLEEKGLSYTVIRYGDYLYEDYIQKLKSCRSMAFFCHSETQGMAYQECLGMNVPIFAWDEGVWVDPASRKIDPNGVPCCSVPYFDDRCGRRFKADGMLDGWAEFWDVRTQFQPRDFIADTLTLSRSAEAYLSAYRSAMG